MKGFSTNKLPVQCKANFYQCDHIAYNERKDWPVEKKRKQLGKYANKLYEKIYVNTLSGTQTFKVQTYAALKNNSFKRSLRWQKKNGKHEGKLIEKNVKFNEFKRQHDPPLWKI